MDGKRQLVGGHCSAEHALLRFTHPVFMHVSLPAHAGRLIARVELQAAPMAGVAACCMATAGSGQLLVADSRGCLHLFATTLHNGTLTCLAQLAHLPPASNRFHEPACLQYAPHSTVAGGPALLVVLSSGEVVLSRVQEVSGQSMPCWWIAPASWPKSTRACCSCVSCVSVGCMLPLDSDCCPSLVLEGLFLNTVQSHVADMKASVHPGLACSRGSSSLCRSCASRRHQPRSEQSCGLLQTCSIQSCLRLAARTAECT